MARTCSDCSGPISDRNASGRCRICIARHNGTDPAMITKRTAGIHRRFADPVLRAQHVENCRRAGAMLTDAERERRREAGRKNIDQLRAASNSMSPEVRAENGRKRTATVLAWCPEHLRDLYRELKKKGVPRADARRAVEAEAMREAERTRRTSDRAKRPLTLEQQLARIEAGAALVARPDTRTGGPDVTLGGVATGMI